MQGILLGVCICIIELALIDLNIEPRTVIDPCLPGLLRTSTYYGHPEACLSLALPVVGIAGDIVLWPAGTGRGCLAAAPLVRPLAAVVTAARLDSNTDF